MSPLLFNFFLRPMGENKHGNTLVEATPWWRSTKKTDVYAWFVLQLMEKVAESLILQKSDVIYQGTG